jgi:hypothetical protein
LTAVAAAARIGDSRARLAASRLRLDTSPLQFTLDDIVSYLKREHGERRPTDDRSSRQDQKRRHLNLQRRIRGKHEQT